MSSFEGDLLLRVQSWLAEFEGMDHACEGEENIGNCGTCYGIELAADLEHEMVELNPDRPLPLVDALAGYEEDGDA